MEPVQWVTMITLSPALVPTPSLETSVTSVQVSAVVWDTVSWITMVSPPVSVLMAVWVSKAVLEGVLVAEAVFSGAFVRVIEGDPLLSLAVAVPVGGLTTVLVSDIDFDEDFVSGTEVLALRVAL